MSFLVTARCRNCGQVKDWTQKDYVLGTTVVEPCSSGVCRGRPQHFELRSVSFVDVADPSQFPPED